MADFIVWNPDNGDAEDGKMFVAYTAEEAAEKWAAREDSWGAEYNIVSGRSEPIVIVRDEAGNETQFKVSGEAVPSYYAREVKGDRTATEGSKNGTEGE
jgi:hypothetical protein